MDIEGHIDRVDGLGAWGWCRNSALSGTTRQVVFCRVDGRLVANISANVFRKDLFALGFDDGCYGFHIHLPLVYFDNRSHLIEFFVIEQAGEIHLTGSPFRKVLHRKCYRAGQIAIDQNGRVSGSCWLDRSVQEKIKVKLYSTTLNIFTIKEIFANNSELHVGFHEIFFNFSIPIDWFKFKVIDFKCKVLPNGSELSCKDSFVDLSKSYFNSISNRKLLSKKNRKLILTKINCQKNDLLFSILMPIYNGKGLYLIQAIESIINQSFSNWELCLVDDASTNLDIKNILKRYSHHPKIKLFTRKKNGHISRATNDALKMADGRYIVLVDHDDLLHADALLIIADVIYSNGISSTALVFSNEDLCDENNFRFAPYFKLGWNRELLLSQNCVSHLGVYRADLVRLIGGFRVGVEGAQDHDLALRITSIIPDEKIHHVPRVLYHWRAIPGSTALKLDSKDYALGATRKVLSNHLDNIGERGRLRFSGLASFFHYEPTDAYVKKSFINILFIINNDAYLLFLNDILREIPYKNVRIFINLRTDSNLMFSNIFACSPHSFDLHYRKKGETFESIFRTFIQEHNKSDLCLIFSNDTFPILGRDKWFKEILSHALRPAIGLVGVKLLTNAETILNTGWCIKRSKTADGSQFLCPTDGGKDSRDHGVNALAVLTKSVDALSPAVFAFRTKAVSAVIDSISLIGDDLQFMYCLSKSLNEHNLRSIVVSRLAAVCPTN